MDDLLYFDTETYSETPIKHGMYRYVEDVEPMIATYAFGDGEIQDWDITENPEMPTDLEYALRYASQQDGIKLVAHNSMFDRNVTKFGLGIDIPIERWHCTLVQAYLHGLPAGLDKLSGIFKLGDEAKDKDGKKLINLFCKPMPKNSELRRATRVTHPEDWRRFILYARGDIAATRRIYSLIPKWNLTGTELAYWYLDQRSNDRGVRIDVELSEAAIRAVDKEQRSLKVQTQILTCYDGNGEGLESTSKRDKMLVYMLEAYGVSLPDLSKATLERRMDDPDLPIELRELLAIRLQVSTTSTSKYKAMIRGVNADGRMRGMIQFAGAFRTARDAGRGIQPQNFPSRGLYPQRDIDDGVELLKLDAADMVFPDVMKLTSSVLRSALCAEEGKKLVTADLSNIEGRYLAWAAGEEWKLQAFRDFDTFVLDDEGNKIPDGDDFERKGPDLYKLAYARAFKIEIALVDKLQRQIGKTMELACLSAETRVLTDNGVKRIVEVTQTDRVWDGEAWQKHKGLVSRGVKQTINLNGLRLTAGHLVLTNRTWNQAEKLALNQNTLDLALATSSESLPWLDTSLVQLAVSGILKLNARVVQNLTTCRFILLEKARLLGATLVLKNKRTTGENISTDTQKSYLMKNTEQDYVTEYQRVSTGVVTKTTKDTKTTEEEVSRFTLLGLRIGVSFWRIWLLSKGGMFLFLNWIELMLIRGINLTTFGLSQEKKTAITNVLCNLFKKKLTYCESVYDIALAGPNSRFTVVTSSGTLIVHNCGFAGGVGAFLTFATAYGLDLDELRVVAYDTLPEDVIKEADEFYTWMLKQKRGTHGLPQQVFVVCDSFKRLWRRAHPMTVALWEGLEDICRTAIQNPNETFAYRLFKARRTGQWLRLQMPSGRSLCYPYPQVDERGGISFRGMNQYTRKWERIKTFGGKLAENITQAGARDVFKHGTLLADQARYPLVFPVHDENVTEVPDTPEYSAEELSRLMSIVPDWATGLPLAAEGFECYRYRK